MCVNFWFLYETKKKKISGTDCILKADKSHLKNGDDVSVTAALSAAGERLPVRAAPSCRQQGSLLLQKLPKHFWASGLRHIRGKRKTGASTYGLMQTPVVKSSLFPLRSLNISLLSRLLLDFEPLRHGSQTTKHPWATGKRQEDQP